MVVLQYTFTRPNTSVNFYDATNNTAVVSAIVSAQTKGDIISFNDNISANGLTMTRTINLPNEAALARLDSTYALATNKQARTAYNNANGITESVSKGTV
jgi:hypothetical protein